MSYVLKLKDNKCFICNDNKLLLSPTFIIKIQILKIQNVFMKTTILMRNAYTWTDVKEGAKKFSLTKPLHLNSDIWSFSQIR